MTFWRKSLALIFILPLLVGIFLMGMTAEEGAFAAPISVDVGDVVVAVSDTEVGVYYATNPIDVSYKFSYMDGEDTVTVESEVPYAEVIPGESGVAVTIVTEGEGELIETFVGTFVKNTDRVIRLPEGQTVGYRGVAVEYEGVTFYEGGMESDLLNVGEYTAKFLLDREVEIAFSVKKGAVTVAPRQVWITYGEIADPTEVIIRGELSEEEEEYLEEHISLRAVGYEEGSPAGTYAIEAIFSGEASENYDLVLEKGVLTVGKADFFGFSFPEITVLYDGKGHIASAEYNENLWPDVTVTYTVGEITEIGKYLCQATVSQENYNDLVLTTYVTIMGESIVGANLPDTVTISNGEGIDPTYKVKVADNEDEGILEQAKQTLAEEETYTEVVKRIVDIVVSDDEGPVAMVKREYQISLKIEGITDSNHVRLMQTLGEDLVELEYTFSDGYFHFSSETLDGIVVIGREGVESDNRAVIIYSVIIGIIVLAVLSIVFDGLTKGKREKKKWKKKHQRWI